MRVVSPGFQLARSDSAVSPIALAVACAFAASTPVWGGPAGEQVVAGQASINRSGATTLITQASDRAAINWQSFSIGTGEAVRFAQPSVSSVALNRVVGQNPSEILGSLSANGQVFLLNPNGVLFGKGAQVDVGGLVASTLNISNSDFLAGRHRFTSTGLASGAAQVVNAGNIIANGGYVALIGPQVKNSGSITAAGGSVALAAGEQVTLNLNGNRLIGLTVGQGALHALADNKGLLKADGGQVLLTAKAVDQLIKSVVNNSGIVEAGALKEINGVIRLEGDTVTSSGTLRADSATGSGGAIALLGERVGLLDGALVDVSGRSGGGTVLVGGDFQGGNALVRNAQRTFVAPGARIRADATGSGDGGKVIVWADGDTRFYGSVSARGGVLSGNGGFVEVSGKEFLTYDGVTDTRAPLGRTGMLLLDPQNIVVDAATNTPLTSVDQFADTPAATVNIRASNINGALSNVTLQANTDITVGTAIAMTTAGVGITLQAGRDIVLTKGIATNNGNIALTANDATALAANRTAGTGDITGAGALNAGTGSVMLTIGSSAAAPFSPGAINLTGAVTGSSLTVTSIGAVSMTGALTVSGDTAVATGASVITFTNAANNFTGAVSASNTGAKAISITDVNALQLGTINTANNLTLKALGITQTAGGVTVGGTLAITSINAGATLNTATNAITNLGATTLGTGALNLLDAGGLTVTGAVGATGGITLNTSGALVVNNTLNAGAGNVSLTTTGAGPITQNATGVITAATLALSTANSSATLNTATNAITNLGATTLGTGTLNLKDAGGLTVTGAVGATGGITLNTAGALTVNNTLNAGAGNVSLTTTGAGPITQNATGVITAATLAIATANSSATLNTATNAITNLGATTLGTGTLNLKDAGGLTVTGAVGASGGITLNTAGALTVNNTLNAGAGNVSLTTTGAGPITQNATGVITAATLALSTANSSATLNTATNAITNLGATTLGTGTLNLKDAGGLTVTGAVGATGGITLNTAGALTVNNTLNAGAGNVSLTTTGAGPITQNATGVITAATLAIATANSSATLNTATNAITNLGATTLGTGTLNLKDAGGLTVTGAVGASGGITLNTAGALTVNNTLNAGAGNVSLTTTGAGPITQNATGVITAATLALSTANSSATLNTATNAITNLGATTLGTGALNLKDAGGLTVTGAVGASGGITLNTAGALVVNNTLNAGAGNVSLTTTGAGPITQNATGVITAATLALATANSSATLNTATNAITNLGATTLGTGTLNLKDAGGLTVTGAVGASGGITLNTAGALTVNNTLNAGAGNVSLTTAGAGPITQNATGVITAATLALATANSSATLNTATNAITNLGATTLGTGALNLKDAGGLTVTGAVGATGGITLNTAGALVVNNTLNAGAGNVSLTTTGAGPITQNATGVITAATLALSTANSSATLNTATNAITNLGAATLGTGTLNLKDAGGLTVTGAVGATGGITLNTAGALTVNNTLNAGAGNVSLTTTGAGPITQNATGVITAATLALSTANSSATLNTATNAITNLGATTLGTGTLNLKDAGGLTVTGAVGATGGITLNTSGALVVNSTLNAGAGNVSLTTTGAGPITQNATGVITAATLALATANSSATLNTATNAITNLGATTLGTGALNLKDAGGLTVTGAVGATGGITLNTSGALAVNNTLTAGAGNVTLTSAGAMTESAAGVITSSGVTTLAAGAANNITLNTATNDFATLAVTNGLNVAVTDKNALILGASTVSGTLSVTVGGALTQSGALTVQGTSSFNAGANAITLNTATNDFTGAVSFTNSGANNVSITDKNAIDLGASVVGANLGVTAGGVISDSGAITAGLLTTTSVGGAVLDFGHTVTSFNATNSGSGNVRLNDIGGVAITGISNAVGNVTLQNNGVVTQSGAISAMGLELLGAGANYTLTNVANNLATLAANTSSVSVVNAGALNIGTVNTVGLNATGLIDVRTQSGDLTLSNAIATTSASANAVTLVADVLATPNATGTGGNFINAGAVAITTGAGGAWRIYSGNPTGTTRGGLVEAGKRYNVDDAADPLAAGNRIYFRNQPALNIISDDKTKTYGAANPVFTFTATGLIDGDTQATAVTTGPAFTVDGTVSTSGQLTAGTLHNITPSAATSNLGYTLNFVAGKLTVDPLALTGAAISASNSTYGAALNPGTVSFTNLIVGDKLSSTASVDTTTKSSSNNFIVGSYTQTAGAISGVDAGNYSFGGFTSGKNYTIDPLALTGTAISASNSTYGAALTAGTVSFTNIIAGDKLSSTASVDTTTKSSSNNFIAGSYTQTAGALSGADAGNYSFGGFTTAAKNYSIDPLALTGAVITASNSTYGAVLNPGTVSFGNLIAGDKLSSTATVDTTTKSSSGNFIAGSYTQTAGAISGVDAGNYSFGGFTSGKNYTIDPLALTGAAITASNSTYGAALTPGTVSFGNLIAGDKLSSTAAVDTTTKSSSNNFIAGSYTQTAGAISGVDAGNYSFGGFTSGKNYTIDPLALTGTAISASNSTYGTALTPGTVSFGNIIAGDKLSSSASVDTTTKSSSGNFIVGSYTQTAGAISGAGAGNYTFGGFTSAKNYTIDPLALTGAAIGASNSTYGAALNPGTVSFGNLIAGDKLSSTATVDTTTKSSSGNFVAGSYTQTAGAISGVDVANYSFGGFTSAKNYTIDPLVLTGAAIAAGNSTYGAALTPGAVSFGNLIAGDKLTSTASVDTTTKSSGGNFVASSYTQTAGAISGADAANYSFGGFTSAKNYSIDPLALTGAAIAASNSTYGAALNPGTVSFTNIIAGDKLGSTASVDTTTKSSSGNFIAGSYTQTAGAISGVDAANYSFGGFTSAKNYSIDPLALTGAAISANNSTYGSALNPGTVSFTNIIAGDKLGSTASVDTTTKSSSGNFVAGSYTQTAGAISGADAGNYTFGGFTTAAKNYTIDLLTLTGVAIGTSNSTYGAALTAGTVSFGNLIAGDKLSSTAAVDTTTKSSSGNFIAGNYTQMAGALSGADAGNYSFGGFTSSKNYTIDPLTLTGAAISASNSTYSAALNPGTVSFTNIIAGDKLSSTAAVDTTTKSSSGNFIAGSYTQTAGAISGADAGNYSFGGFTTAAKNYTITPAAIANVSDISASNKVYDATTAATLNSGAAGFTGILGADVLTVATASGAFTDKNVANGKTVNISGITLGGADAGNYTLTTNTATAIANITPAAIANISGISANNKVYDATTAASLNTVAAVFIGALGADSLTVATASGVFADKNAGIGKTVSISGLSLGGTDADNYTLSNSTASAAATITPAPLSVVFTGVNRVYDGTTAATALTTDNRFTGDTLTINRTANFADANAGTGKPIALTGVALSGADAGNYTVFATGSASADIAPRGITLSADSVSRIYGNPDPVFTFQVGGAGLAGGDTLTGVLTGALARAPGENVAGSPYAIVQGSLVLNANYSISAFSPGQLTITPRALSITADNKAGFVGSALPPFTASYTGLALADTPASLAGALTFTTPATPTSSPGIYTITPSGQASANYRVSYVSGILSLALGTNAVSSDLLASITSGATQLPPPFLSGPFVSGPQALPTSFFAAVQPNNVTAGGTQNTVAQASDLLVAPGAGEPQPGSKPAERNDEQRPLLSGAVKRLVNIINGGVRLPNPADTIAQGPPGD